MLNTNVIALKLVHMLYCSGLIDGALYHQVLMHYT